MANLAKIICPTCKGNGFYRIPYHLTHDEQYAQCDDCDRQGHHSELTIEENYTPKELRDKHRKHRELKQDDQARGTSPAELRSTGPKQRPKG